jgi:hypothetical protein
VTRDDDDDTNNNNNNNNNNTFVSEFANIMPTTGTY